MADTTISDPAQKDLLIGEVIHKFNHLPEELKHRFVREIQAAQRQKIFDRMDDESKKFLFGEK